MNEKILHAGALSLLLALAACGGGPENGHRDHGAAEHEHEAHAHDEHGHDEHGHDEHGHDAHGHAEADPDFARIAPAEAARHGIEVAVAAGGPVAETVTLTGRLIIDPGRIAAVRARFPGPVVRVHREVGQSVGRGDVLADVESNESLTVYAVRSPLAGVVLERRTNVGDVAATDPLFRVGDVSRLQAELKAFPSQRGALAVGAPARVDLGEASTTGRVVAIAPELDGHTQALDVRVALDPTTAVALVPGQFVTGVVEGGRTDATVAVPPEAVQRLDGREVVFVPEAAGFRARPVTVGRRGASHVEIREGLAAGTRYVAKGAFLLKAEIGKHEAAHEH